MTAWHSFIGHPLFSVGLTLLAFQLAVALYRRSGWLLLQPVLVGMLLIVAALGPSKERNGSICRRTRATHSLTVSSEFNVRSPESLGSPIIPVAPPTRA